MTEQEKREKAIEEMAQVQPCPYGCENCIEYGLNKKCKDWVLAERLYDAGYRKEEEVQKETAKEIYTAVLDLRELMVNNDDALCILRNVESWAKEDGVEV